MGMWYPAGQKRAGPHVMHRLLLVTERVPRGQMRQALDEAMPGEGEK
jgi:hypothetical protein